jgi:hypothetical protein
LLGAIVVEHLEAEPAIRDVDIVERLAVERIIEATEVAVDVIFSPLNPLTWIKVLLKGSLKAWRAVRTYRRRRRTGPPKQMS